MTARLNIWAMAHPHILIIIAILTPLLVTVYFLLHRDPPTVITAQPSVPTARVGEEVVFEVPIDRDLTRGCSLVLTRTIVDASMQATVIVQRQEIGQEGLALRDKMDENFFRVRFTVPRGLPSGRARLLTDVSWRCIKNPTTWLFPIQRTWNWPFDILPPDPRTIIVIPAQPPGESK